MEAAFNLGADKIATGHYIQIKEENGQFKIHIPKDASKDQTYMIWKLNQFQLSKTLFPISQYHKPEIRKIAEKFNLPIHTKTDSQEICFIKNHYEEFLKDHIDTFNRKLKIDQDDLKYSFGIGLHTASARFIEMKYQTNSKKSEIKKFILGNAANSAARVESMTKNFIGIDLLVTGYTRKQSDLQADKRYKRLFKKNGDYMSEIGNVRHNIGDGRLKGHSLYTVSDSFYEDYHKIRK